MLRQGGASKGRGVFPIQTIFGSITSLFLLSNLSGSANTLLVSRTSLNPTPPYANWDTAAANIQDAINVASSGDLVLVTNGVYPAGLIVYKPLTVLSINGPQVTAIDGAAASRCVSMSDGASLSGFTLTNGWALMGGGISCDSTNAFVTNCVIVGNMADDGAGAYSGTLYNCLLNANTAVDPYGLGGGADQSILYNCTVSGNKAFQGGGILIGTAYNSILYDNAALYDTNFSSGQTLNYCCTSPLATNGVGNITNAPLFGGAMMGNFRLDPASPCINAGTNGFVDTTVDLDGRPRFSGGTVDIGAYEALFSGAPTILMQPSSQTVYAGVEVGFTAAVSGALPLVWQWRFNEKPIPDATNSTLILKAVKPAQAGDYSVVVTNSLGSITSQVATLTIQNTAPLITANPNGQTVYAGTNVSFSAAAVGSLPLSWQWYFEHTPVQDAANSTLTLSGVTTNSSGNYFAVVTNSLGSATSQVAVLKVLAGFPPQVTLHPTNQTVTAGNSVTFMADASGYHPLFWQWFFNGSAIRDATNSSLTLNAVTTQQAGDYFATVTNIVGAAVTSNATLIVKVSGPKYVWQNSPNPVPPFSSWSTAGTRIQDVISAAVPGDQIIVSNGVYSESLSIDKPLTLVSVNGPESTVIDAYQMGTCISSLNGPLNLSGFTVTNGYGGIFCYTNGCFVTNCVIVGNFNEGFGGGAFGCTFYNCTVSDNSAAMGGGVYESTLYNCTINNNMGFFGNGGTRSSTLFNCLVTSNYDGAGAAGNFHGAVEYCNVYNCTVANNLDGGALASQLYNSIVYYNGAHGVLNYNSSCTFSSSCTLPLPPSGAGNIASAPLFVDFAGGNLRLQPNSPCINAGNNAFVSGSTDLDGNPRIVKGTVDMGAYEFQTPGSVGPPVILLQSPSQTVYAGAEVDLFAVASGSVPLFWQWRFNHKPILDATNSIFILPAVKPVQAGDYTVVVTNSLGSVTSQVATLTIQNTAPSITGDPNGQTVLAGANVSFSAYALGSLPLSWQWYFENTPVRDATNSSLTLTGVTTNSSGNYFAVVTNSLGSATSQVAVLKVMPLTMYAWQNSTNPVPPFSSWSAAATGIQQVVEIALPGNQIVVSNGIYAETLDLEYKSLTLVSVNGPEFTVIDGHRNNYCVRKYGGSLSLSGFTLTNGVGGITSDANNCFVTNCVIVGNGTLTYNAYGSFGGGAMACTLYNCVVSNNFAAQAGGVSASTLYNCTLNNNGALYGNGGAGSSTLYNCLITSNSSWAVENCNLYNCTVANNPDGGAYSSQLNNSIVYYNGANGASNYDSTCAFASSCTLPFPTGGVANITNAPLLVNLHTGDFRLQDNSPCINAGNNAFVWGSADLDGNPRIVRGTVDIGAYEFQGAGSMISLVWLQQWGLPTDGSADYADPDGDGLNNWQEWISGTDPTDPASALRLLSVSNALGEVNVTWQSVSNTIYFVERGAARPFWSLAPGNLVFIGTNALVTPSNIVLLATNVLGNDGATTYADTNATGWGPYFYRVGVKAP
jgi:hypothetical protein